jgi:hypothetical protein
MQFFLIIYFGFATFAVLGIKPTDVSIQVPQLQPPPASGASNMPPAGIVLSQQPGRNRAHCEGIP